MRILFNISTIVGGGAGRVMSCIANKFAEAGDEVGFITSYIQDGEYRLDERIRRFPLAPNGKKSGAFTKNVSWTLKIGRICRDFAPDAVVSFLPEPNFRLLLATGGKKFARIVSVRSDPAREYRSKLYKMLAKSLYKKADGVVFQTSDAREWFCDEIKSHSVILPNQVDDRFFGVQRSGERRNIVSTGRLSKPKNQKLLIDAFSRVADKTDDDLIIYGEGALRQELEEQIKRLGLSGRVHLPGATTDVVGSVNDAKLYVLSSDYEGMPNALLEALAMGVPSISTDCPCGGPREIIEDGVSGMLVPVGDADALADKLSYALENPDKMEEMGNAASKSACRFRSDKVYEEWRSYIEQLVEQKKHK